MPSKLRMQLHSTSKKVIDVLISEDEESELFVYTLGCTAPDNVNYKWVVLSIFFQDKLKVANCKLNYKKEDVISKKRPFSFNSVIATDEELEILLADRVVGFYSREAMRSFLASLSGVKFISSNGQEDRYIFEVPQEEDILSRIYLWNFSRRVKVSVDSKNIVQSISIKGY